MAALADLVAIKTALVQAQAAFLKDIKEWEAIVNKEKAARKPLEEALKKAKAARPANEAAVAKAQAALDKHVKAVKPLAKEADAWGMSHMMSENSIRQLGSKLPAMVTALERGHADLKKLAQKLAEEAIAAAKMESGAVPEGRARSGAQDTEGRPRR